MNGAPVAVVEGGQVFFVRTDHIGRPVFATNDLGVKVWEASYLPFGGVHASTGGIDLRFPGQWFQLESGLHQNWMRDYDPTTGRYIQADPLGLVDGASVYGYARQNPGRYVDPRGELAFLIPLIPTVIGGSGAGASLTGVLVGAGILIMAPNQAGDGSGPMPIPLLPPQQCTTAQCQYEYDQCKLTRLDDLNGRVFGEGRCEQCRQHCQMNNGAWPSYISTLTGRKSCRYWLKSYN